MKAIKLAASVLGLAMFASMPVAAQPAPPDAPPPAPPDAPPPATPPDLPPPDVRDDVAPPPVGAVSQKPDALSSSLAVESGGLTPKEVADRAIETSFSLEAKRAQLRTSSAQVDRALVSYFPTLTFIASYTRVSDLDNELDTGGGALLGAQNEGPIVTGPCPGNPGVECVLDAGGVPVGAQSIDFGFPTVLNNYALSASLVVPISDYLLRLSQAYDATKLNVSSKEHAVQAERLKIAADAKVAFYQWVKAKGQTVVAGEAVGQARTHVGDAKKAFAAGLVAKADVLRLQAQVARAQQLEASAGAFELVAAEQVRAIMHAPPDERLKVGVDVFAEPSSKSLPALAVLLQRAYDRRLELRALGETHQALEEVESATKAAYLPRIEAFANGVYANPNPRVFPQQEQWDFTWDVGARIIWTVNETFSTLGAEAEAEARVAEVAAQRAAFKDGIRMQVAGAYAEVMGSAPSIAASEFEVQAAEESLRVRRKLYQFGKATTADLIDAETELTRARLRWLDASIGLLVAWVRLEHATGGDVRG